MTPMSHRRPMPPDLRRAVAALRSRTRVTFGPYVNEGMRRLWALMKRRKLTALDVATTVGIDASTVHLHLHGDRRPDVATREAYRLAYTIHPPAWDAKPAAPFVLPALGVMADKARTMLATVGDAGMSIGAVGSACSFAGDPIEADILALLAIYTLSDAGHVQRVPGEPLWQLTTAGKAAAARAVTGGAA